MPSFHVRVGTASGPPGVVVGGGDNLLEVLYPGPAGQGWHTKEVDLTIQSASPCTLGTGTTVIVMETGVVGAVVSHSVAANTVSVTFADGASVTLPSDAVVATHAEPVYCCTDDNGVVSAVGVPASWAPQHKPWGHPTPPAKLVELWAASPCSSQLAVVGGNSIARMTACRPAGFGVANGIAVNVLARLAPSGAVSLTHPGAAQLSQGLVALIAQATPARF